MLVDVNLIFLLFSDLFGAVPGLQPLEVALRTPETQPREDPHLPERHIRALSTASHRHPTPLASPNDEQRSWL